MAVHTLFFITRLWIENRLVRQKSAPLVGHAQQIAMTFLAMTVIHICIGPFAILGMVVPGGFHGEMSHHILDPVVGLGLKELKAIIQGR